MSETLKVLISVWALAVVLMLGFILGESYMESDCTHYGKFVDGQSIYICEKQK